MGQKLKKYNMGQQKEKIHAEANAEILAGHMVAAASGGRDHVVIRAASICSICLRMDFLLLPHIAFSAFGPNCIFCRVFYQVPCNQKALVFHPPWR